MMSDNDKAKEILMVARFGATVEEICLSLSLMDDPQPTILILEAVKITLEKALVLHENQRLFNDGSMRSRFP